MPLTQITAPDGEPVSLENAKHQCSLDGTTAHDAFFATVLIPSARDRAQLATRRQLLEATWEWQLDRFPCVGVLELPKPPLIAVSSVKYTDTAGATQTFAASNYTVQAFAGERCVRGRIGLKTGVSWPTDVAINEIGAVQIRFTCGYGAAEDIPPLLHQAQLIDISTLFEYRENIVTGTIVADVPGAAKDIYRSFKSRASMWSED